MFRNALSLTLVAVLAFASPSLRAQAPAAPELAALADAKLSKWFDAKRPGAAVLLMQDGRVLFQKGYGLANVELGVPVQPDMVFRIGSVTKQFTAVAVMKLVEEGKVDLQAPISRYLEKLPRAWRAVTVEQLLQHTSGIPNYTKTKTYWDHMGEDLTPAQVLEACVSSLPLDFQPGTQYRYSNTGYTLLGLIIEKVADMPYDHFLRKRLLEPLGLAHTRRGLDSELLLGMTSGYRRGPRPAHYENMTQVSADGVLVSNAEDLARWTLALHEGKVVKPESLARMLAPTKFQDGTEHAYGFGLTFRQSQGHRLVGHSGSISGFTCIVEADPATKAVAVILNNTEDGRGDDEYFSRWLLSLAAGKPLPEPQPVALEPARLRRLTGLYALEDQTRTVTFEDGGLCSRLEGHAKYKLIPLSETEFAYEDSDTRVRFELEGDRVAGFHRSYGDGPESALHKRLEPLQDKDPKVTELLQHSLAELAAGTLKPDAFVPALARQIFPDTVEEMRADLKALGPQTALGLYKREERKNGLCLYLYRVTFGDKNLALYLWMTKDLKVADFDSVLE